MTRMRSINNTLALATIALSVAACGDSPTTPSVMDLSGTFSYEESLSTSNDSVFCNGGGTLSLQQAGTSGSGTLTSTGTCVSSPTSDHPYTHSGAITELAVRRLSDSNAEISFRTPMCRFDGVAVRGTQTTQLAGNMVCQNGLGTVTAPLNGNWLGDK